MKDIYIDNVKIDCEIIRKCIRRIYISYKDDKIIVRAPYSVKDNEIYKIIVENEDQLKKIIKKVNNKTKLSFENGSSIMFYGKEYKIIYSNESFIRGEYIYLDSKSPSDSFYNLAKKHGKIFYKERIEFFISNYYLPYKVNNIVVRDMKTRYGVCNIKDKKITFQLKLATYPLECIDYVIVHELSHFKVQNHSKDFYYEIAKIMPDYKKRIKKLKEY